MTVPRLQPPRGGLHESRAEPGKRSRSGKLVHRLPGRKVPGGLRSGGEAGSVSCLFIAPRGKLCRGGLGGALQKVTPTAPRAQRTGALEQFDTAWPQR